MQYLLLIYVNEKTFDSLPEPEMKKMMGEYMTFNQELRANGTIVGGNRLQSVHNATTVRVREGKTQLTDGPFAETREQLGGYFLIEAPNLDAATAIAARIPGARYGAIEVRPIVPM